MIVVLADDVTGKYSVSAREIRATIEAAKMYGCRVFLLPPEVQNLTPEESLMYVPHFDEPVLAVWVGFIPMYERYRGIYDVALKRNIHLVNTPQQYQTAMEFDKFYPLIENLTPESVIIEAISDLHKVTETLEFPVFVKGSVKSNKEKGLSAVVANNEDELKQLVQEYLAQSYRSRGKVIVRELVSLKKLDEDANGFPISREYRVFVHHGKMLDYGFYWDDYQDKAISSKVIEKAIKRLLSDMNQRIATPFFAMDIGQLESGEWIIIELGDGQFSGLSQIPILRLWSKISQWEYEQG